MSCVLEKRNVLSFFLPKKRKRKQKQQQLPTMASRLSARLLLRHLSTAQFLPRSHPFARSLLNPKHQLTPTQNPSHVLLRHLSTRFPTRATRIDIGARARQMQTRRLWTYALTFSCIAGFIVIVLNQFQDQLVFYITPTDALQKYTSNPTKSKFRLGGLVLENSVLQVPSSPETQFVITDLITDILVRYEGSLPDLFREGHSVVVEGFIRPVDEEMRREESSLGNSSKLKVAEKARGLGCYFSATEVLAKHDEKYMPAEVATAIERNKKLIEAEEGAVVNASGGAAPAKV